jgi:hypothetical protein
VTIHNRTAIEAVSPPATVAGRTFTQTFFKVGGRMYRFPNRNSNCKVCKNWDYLPYIESNLNKGYGYTMIWNSLPEDVKAEISVRNITSHAKAHFQDTDLLVAHAAVRQRAEEIGVDIEGSTQSLIDHISFARLVMQDVFQRWKDGEIAPEFKDGMIAAQFLAKVEETAGGDVDRDTMVQTMLSYLAVVKATVTPEQLQTIRLTLDSDPVFQALEAKNARSAIVEGEVLDDESGE